METLKKIFDFIVKIKDFILIGIVVILVFIGAQQCNKAHRAEDEIKRLENNELALNDTIKCYTDINGNLVAEKRALQLSQDELIEEVNLLKKKNREYIAYINSNINIKDTVRVPVVVEIHDTIGAANGVIKSFKEDTFGKSYRKIGVEIPFTIDDRLNVGDAEFSVSQDIFIEGALERDIKTGETFMMIRTDYPGVMFNSGTGVVVSNSKEYDRSMRKSQGIGICIGPSVGLGYDMINKNMSPTVGISITVGWTYTPKAFQWGK